MKLHSILSRFVLPVVAVSVSLSQPAMAEDDKADTPLLESMEEANKARIAHSCCTISIKFSITHYFIRVNVDK